MNRMKRTKNKKVIDYRLASDESESESKTSGSEYAPSSEGESEPIESDSSNHSLISDEQLTKPTSMATKEKKNMKTIVKKSDNMDEYYSSESDKECKKMIPAKNSLKKKKMISMKFTPSISIRSESDSSSHSLISVGKLSKPTSVHTEEKKKMNAFEKKCKYLDKGYSSGSDDEKCKKKIPAKKSLKKKETSMKSTPCTSKKKLNEPQNSNSNDLDFINIHKELDEIPSQSEKFDIEMHSNDSAMEISDNDSDNDLFIGLKEPSHFDILKCNLPAEHKKQQKNKNVKEALTITKEKAQVSSKEQSNLESSIGSANSSFNISINLESVGLALKNQHTEIVPSSNQGTKKNACLYCLIKRIKTKDNSIKVLFSKLVEHYEKAHKYEKLIEKLSDIPKVPLVKGSKKDPNQKKREEILNYLRNQANHYNNILSDKGSEYVVSRRTQKEQGPRTISRIGYCTKCKKHMSKDSLRKHVSKCTSFSYEKRRVVQSSSRAMIGNYHPIATEDAIKIISKMREDERLETIRYDYTIFLFLNAAGSRFRMARRHHKKVRANLSRLAKFKLLMMKSNSNVEEFSDIFDKNKMQDIVDCVAVMGKPDPVSGLMQSPATASDMYHLIKQSAELYKIKIDSNESGKIKIVTTFIEALKTDWHNLIGNTIAECQAEKSRNKPELVPDTEDIASLRSYLEKEMNEAYSELKNKYSDDSYEKLRDSVVSYLHCTNCRRAAEIENLTITEFSRKTFIDSHYRVQVRGKRTKPVPIVFDEFINSCLVILTQNRENAKICKKNDFLFSKTNDVNDEFEPVSACNLMTDFASLCGAKKPELLRGTYFRKQAATEGMNRGLDEHNVEKLAGYLGHTSRIHHHSYRQSVVERDVRTAKMVKDFQTSSKSSARIPSSKNYVNKNTVDNRNVSSELNEELGENQDNDLIDNSLVLQTDSTVIKKGTAHDLYSEIDATPSEKGTANNSPSQPGSTINQKDVDCPALKRNRYTAWKAPQIKVFLAHFPDALNLKKNVPNANSIRNFIATTKDDILKNRTEPQIRSWIHTQRKLQEKKYLKIEKNSVPSWIYSTFRLYIQAGKVPSSEKCGKVLGSSPSKLHITVENIQNWVSRAIKLKSKPN